MDFFQMSLSGAVLILAVTVVRVLFLNHLPKITFHILWMAALIRLLVPFSLSSATSIYTWIPGLEAFEETMTASLSEFLSTGAGMDDAAAQQTAGDGANGSAERQTAGAETNDAAAWQTTGNNGTAGLSGVQGAGAEDRMLPSDEMERKKLMLSGGRGIGGILLLRPVCLAVWLAGAVVLALCFIFAYVRAYREFGTSLPVENKMIREWLATHFLKRKLEVRYSDRICTPLSYRVLRPVILLPGRAEDRKSAGTDGCTYARPDETFRQERRGSAQRDSLLYILEHEYVHIQRLDALTKILMAAALCLHWFNPFVWMMYILFNRDMELSCDEAVLCRFGEKTKSAYAMTLIGMEERKDRFTPLFNNFSRNAVEERIGAIMKLKKRTPGRLVTACLTIMVICGLFATSAMKQPAQAAVDAQSKTAVEDKKESAYAEDAIRAAEIALGELNHAVARQEEAIRAAETALREPNYTIDGQEETVRAAEEVNDDLESLYETLTYLQLEQEDMERLIFFEQEYGSYGIHYDPTGDGTLRMDGRTVGHFVDEDNGGALWAANGCELSVTVERDDGEIAYFVVMTEGDAKSSFTVKAVENTRESGTDAQTEAVTDTETMYTDMPGEVSTTATADMPGEAFAAIAEDITEEMPMKTAENAEEEMSAIAMEDAMKEMPAGAVENTREDVSKNEAAVSEMLKVEDAVADGNYEPSGEDLKREQEYREAGIRENPHTGEWLYDGRVISMLVDEDGGIYMNNMEDTPKEDRLYVIVERDEDGNVKGVKTVTQEDAVLSYAKNRY